jgi:hypothetical protein
MAFVDAQPINNMKYTAIHPNTVAKSKLLAVFIRPLFAFCGLRKGVPGACFIIEYLNRVSEAIDIED